MSQIALRSGSDQSLKKLYLKTILNVGFKIELKNESLRIKVYQGIQEIMQCCKIPEHICFVRTVGISFHKSHIDEKCIKVGNCTEISWKTHQRKLRSYTTTSDWQYSYWGQVLAVVV